MGYGDNDNDGYGQAANYGGRPHYGHTPDLDTTAFSSDGSFFGIKMSPEMAGQFKTFYNQFLEYARRKAEKITVPAATYLASKITNPATARQIGNVAGDIAGYSTILSQQILNTGRNIYDSLWALNEVRVAGQPLAGSNSSVGALSGNNEVIANARGRVNSLFWQKLMEEGVSMLAVAPDLITKFQEQAAINKLNKSARDFEQARASGNEEVMLEELRKHTPVGSVSHSDHQSDPLEGAIGTHLKSLRKKYETDVKQFVHQNAPGFKDELHKILDGMTAANAMDSLKMLERHGVDVSDLREDLRYFRGNRQDTQQRVNDFCEQARTPEFIEHALRGKYEKEHDSFDSISERFINNVRGLDHKQHEEKQDTKELDKESNYILKMGSKLVAGVAAEKVGGLFFGGKAGEKYQKPIALDRILHLRRELENAQHDAPELVPGIESKNRKYRENDMSYTRFVHEIFQQHQRDSGRIEIGERFVSNFDNARWNDETIQNLTDDQLSAYEYAVKTIAQRIKSGRMDAIALIELVGDRQKKIVGNDGRTFGPAGSAKDDKSAKEAISKIIDEKTALLHAGQKQTAAEVNDKLGNFVFSVEDLKKALDSEALDKSHRAFIFTVFSDVMGNDENLCKKLGINMERCKELRSECKERFTTMLDGAVNVLADMIQNNPKALDKLALSDREKELILTMAEHSQSDSKHVADAVKSRDELSIIERSVANAAMTLGREPGGREQEGFWQRVVSAVRPKMEEKPAPENTGLGYVEREAKRQAGRDESPNLSTPA